MCLGHCVFSVGKRGSVATLFECECPSLAAQRVAESVVVLTDGTRYLAETKGREDVDVARKDRAAQIWCENATLLTDVEWRYIKVPEKDFGKLQPTDFVDLQAL